MFTAFWGGGKKNSLQSIIARQLSKLQIFQFSFLISQESNFGDLLKLRAVGVFF